MKDLQAENRPLYWQDWWLDIAAGPGGWERKELLDGEQVLASWVICRKTKGPWQWIGMPAFTAYSGPWINPLALPPSPHKRIQYVLESLRALAAQWPQPLLHYQQLLPQADLQMPLSWMGYKQAWRYTFRVEADTEQEYLLSQADGKLRTHLRKAREEMHYVQAPNPGHVLEYWEALEARGKGNPGDSALLGSLLRAAREAGCCEILEARDGEDRCQASLALVWDAQTTYLLCALRDPLASSADALQGLIWVALCRSLQAGRNFDFEGSVIPAVYQSFQGFGAHLTPHPLIWKTQYKWVDHWMRYTHKGIYTL